MDSLSPVDIEEVAAKAGSVDRRWRLAWFGGLALAIGALVWLAVDATTIAAENAVRNRAAASTQVDLSEEGARYEGADPAVAPSADVLRVAIAPMASPERSLAMYGGLMEYLSEALGCSATMVLRNTYADVNALVRCEQCDLAFVCTASFVDGQRAFGMVPLVIPVVGGATEYRSLIIVPAGSDVETLSDLAGKRFASADRLSTSGWLHPASVIRAEGHAPDAYFSELTMTGSHDRALQAVAAGYVDGGAIESIVYDQLTKDDPDLAGQVRVVSESGSFGMPPVVVPAGLDATRRSQIREVLLGMHSTAEGRGVLAKMGVDRYVIPEAGAYDTVRELMAAVWEADE